MKIFSLKKLAAFLVISVVALLADGVSAADEPLRGIFGTLRDSYDELPQSGKFATGAALGFTSTRFALNKAVGIVKFGCAAFIASEALSYAGVLEKIPDEQMATVNMVKKSAVNVLEDFRVEVRRRFKPEGIKESIETIAVKERMATLGFASGAFVSFVL